LDKQWAEESGVEYADKPYRSPTAVYPGVPVSPIPVNSEQRD
jgi:hypothetical protein